MIATMTSPDTHKPMIVCFDANKIDSVDTEDIPHLLRLCADEIQKRVGIPNALVRKAHEMRHTATQLEASI